MKTLRILGKSPAFAVVAVLSLALGIGANTAIFQLVDAIRLRSLPVTRPDELARVRIADMAGARGAVNRPDSVTYGIWEQIRKRQEAFSGLFAWADTQFNLSPAGEVRMTPGLWVTGETFRVLGVDAAAGRLFGAADDHRGCATSPGAVISYGFWQREFGGDRSVIGRKLTLNAHPVEVIGVTQAGFYGLEVGRSFNVALPVCSAEVVQGFNPLDAGTFWWLTVMGRLNPGWTPERASAQLRSISKGVFDVSLPAGYPPVSVEKYLGLQLIAEPAGTGISGMRARYSEPLYLLLAITGLVLLIACANLANLMLARASVREREIAVRLAIGAPRGRIVRMLMGESLTIAGLGAAAGLVVAQWLSRLLVTLIVGQSSSVHVDLGTDWRVLGFTAGLAVLTCVLFGLTPAFRASRASPGDALKSGSRGSTAGRERLGLRRALVVSQVALSLVLLVGALLFAGSLRNLANVDTGFQREGVLIADLGFARPNPSMVKVLPFQKALLERIGRIPGVVSVADTTVLPLGGTSWSNRVWMEGSDAAAGREVPWSRVSPGYFRTLGMGLLGGRDFDAHDLPGSPNVAIVNEAFARVLAGGANPVGKRFTMETTPSTPATVYEVVGMVRNAKYRDLREDFAPIFYLPLAQDPHPQLGDQLLIRTAAPLGAITPELRRALAEVDPEARFELGDFREVMDSALERERMMAMLSSGFGILAAALAAMGLYGVVSFMVARRRNEIGIRMALGADRGEILSMMLRETGKLLAVGMVCGVALAMAGARAARTMFFGLTPYDAATLGTAVALLAAVGFAASYVPARRAAAVDPLTALRDE